MMPIGPLMIEHRLIEKMIALMKSEAAKIGETKRAGVKLIDTAIDFVRTYADALHHGKEEQILFRDLANKPLSDEHRMIMDELIEEHKKGRANVRELIAARERYMNGDEAALNDIAASLESIAGFYPGHIEKEDKRFFLPIMKYFTKEEQDAMLAEFEMFDQNFIHVKYKIAVDELINS
ncbi:MAG: hemerythrin domain-containing protein [bacterium]